MVLKIRPHNVCPSKIRTFQVCVESKQVPNDALSKWIKIWLQNETSTLVYVSVKIFPCHKLAIAYISNQSKLWYTCCTCRTCPSQWNSIDECRTTYLTTIFDDKQCNNNVYAFKVGHFSSMLFFSPYPNRSITKNTIHSISASSFWGLNGLHSL